METGSMRLFHVWLPLLNMFEKSSSCCWNFSFLMLSSLYILDINPLLDISFANQHLWVFIVNSHSLEPYWNNALRSVFKVKVAQSCPTLYSPWNSLQASRTLEWMAFPFSRGSSQPRDQTQVSHVAGGFFTSWSLQRGLFYQISGDTSIWVGQI